MEGHRAAPAETDRGRTPHAANYPLRGSQRFASGFATNRAWTARGAFPLQGRLNTLPLRDLPALHQIRLSTPVAASPRGQTPEPPAIRRLSCFPKPCKLAGLAGTRIRAFSAVLIPATISM